MKMKIKTKLSLGILFLFCEFLLVSIIGSYYLWEISKQTKEVLKNNYNSVKYTENMLQSLENLQIIQTSQFLNSHYLKNEEETNRFLKNFQENLNLEESNITEKGERDLVHTVKGNYSKFIKLLNISSNDSVKDKPAFYFANVLPNYNDLKNSLFAISDLNMNAVIAKSEQANAFASRFFFYLMILVVSCFLISMLFVFSFPTYISNPVNELILRMKEIANRNYKSRLHFNSNDEFDELAEAYNTMVSRLEEFDKSHLGKIMNEKKRLETVFGKLKDAVLVLDPDKKIIFVNQLAANLLNKTEAKLIEEYAPVIAIDNDLMRFLLMDNEGKMATIELVYKEEYINFVKEVTNVETTDENGESAPVGQLIVLRRTYPVSKMKSNHESIPVAIEGKIKNQIDTLIRSLEMLSQSNIEKVVTDYSKSALSIREEAKEIQKLLKS
jgi:PAS domain-containing protein